MNTTTWHQTNTPRKRGGDKLAESASLYTVAGRGVSTYFGVLPEKGKGAPKKEVERAVTIYYNINLIIQLSNNKPRFFFSVCYKQRQI